MVARLNPELDAVLPNPPNPLVVLGAAVVDPKPKEGVALAVVVVLKPNDGVVEDVVPNEPNPEVVDGVDAPNADEGAAAAAVPNPVVLGEALPKPVVAGLDPKPNPLEAGAVVEPNIQ